MTDRAREGFTASDKSRVHRPEGKARGTVRYLASREKCEAHATKIACEGHVRNLWDFSCIPDGGLERIDIFHFIATSTDSNSDPFLANVSMTFMHESKATSPQMFERFLTSGKSSECKMENAFIQRQQVNIWYRETFINAPAVRKINTSVKHCAGVRVV